MKTSALAVMLILLFGGFISAQPIPPDSLYLGQTPPGNTPQIFNLSVNPGSFPAERIAFSNDNKEIYYSELHNYYPASGDTIKCYKYTGNHWTGPVNLFQGFLAPALSVGGDTMYFQTDTIQNSDFVYQTFFSERSDIGWTNPRRFLANLNSAHYLQVTANGHYYISSIANPGIGAADWCHLSINGTDTIAKSLGLPLNSTGDNLDFFVSKDETYMILAKNGLQISYHKDDGSWTNPKSLGSQINFGLGMWGPYVSSDNKYLFYTTGTQPDYSDTYVYWVRIDSLIDSLMYTNFVPYIKNPIPQQTAFNGQLFTFTIPDSTFIDDDENNTLTYHAKLTNGSPLPAWLAFDTIAGNFTGIPAIIETLNIRVTATDIAGASVTTTFKIKVIQPTSINLIKEQGIRIFPNPTTGLIHVCLNSFSGKEAIAEIRNPEGKLILKKTFEDKINIDLAGRARGLYTVKLIIDQDVLIHKIIKD